MDLVGKTLAGRYEILEEIGKGGMAHVYKAWCNMLNRFVAIKALKEEFKDDKEFVRRFNVEAQAAAGISDLHVVSIYDVGYEDGIYYIVMEYVEGITLKEYIAGKGALPWREAAGYAAQICEGLEAAHKSHVIHRDIKPQNIIMTPDGVLKVTDFGIARASGNQATMTMANTAIGTVHYLSPEQARGGYTDERTDIYSLGVVLYEMQTGKLPFTDDSAVAVAIKQIQEEPIPPREINPDIPEAMEKVILKAMKKEQSQRYASAGEFLNDIRKVMDDPNCSAGDIGQKQNNDDTDDLTSTIKLKKIDDETIDEYESRKEDEGGYAKYASKVDKAVEERKLREIDEKREKRNQKKKERRVTLIAILAAVLVVAGLGFAFSAMTGGFSFMNGSETVEIPNLVGMDIVKAQNQYKEQGFSIVRDKEVPSDKEAGVILEQSPEATTKKNKNSSLIIKVTVSAGNDVKALESYVNRDKKDAQKALKDAGFQVNIIEDYSDSTEKDKVIAQEPAAGSMVSPGALVTLRVSKGSEKPKDNDNKPDSTATEPGNNSKPEPEKPANNNKPSTPSEGEGGGTATTAPNGNNTSGTSNNEGNTTTAKPQQPTATGSEVTPGISD